MKDFRDLHVWHKSHAVVLTVYQLTRRFPKEELYGLTSQLRRSAVSVGSNIAEGCGRGSDADFARFLQIAMGSACELEYQVFLASDLGYLEEREYAELQLAVAEVKRMLSGLMRRMSPDAQLSLPADC